METLQTLKVPQSDLEEQAFVLINCHDGDSYEIKEKISSIEGVKDVIYTIGNYDLIVKIESSSVEKLRDVIIFEIRQIQNIRKTTTIVCV